MYRWHGYPAYPPHFGNGYGPFYTPYNSQQNGANGAVPPYPAYYNQAGPHQSGGLLPMNSDSFLKGALIGAAAAYILTNENVQHSMIKGTVKAWSLLQGGVEEMKERFRDAEAEIMAEQADEDV